MNSSTIERRRAARLSHDAKRDVCEHRMVCLRRSRRRRRPRRVPRQGYASRERCLRAGLHERLLWRKPLRRKRRWPCHRHRRRSPRVLLHSAEDVAVLSKRESVPRLHRDAVVVFPHVSPLWCNTKTEGLNTHTSATVVEKRR